MTVTMDGIDTYRVQLVRREREVRRVHPDGFPMAERAARHPRRPWSRTWQAEWDGCQRAPRAWTERGVLRRARRWKRYRTEGPGLVPGRGPVPTSPPPPSQQGKHRG